MLAAMVRGLAPRVEDFYHAQSLQWAPTANERVLALLEIENQHLASQVDTHSQSPGHHLHQLAYQN